jgi:hypothetical protein
MAVRRSLTVAVGIFLTALGTLGAMAGSLGSMVALFAGLILVAIGVDRA